MKKQKAKQTAVKMASPQVASPAVAITDSAARPETNSRPAKSNAATTKAARQAELKEQLLAELAALRSSCDEMVDRYRLKLEAELLQLETAARGEQMDGAPTKGLPVRTADDMRARIQQLDIKPQKGRPKDFARVRSLVDDLIELLPSSR